MRYLLDTCTISEFSKPYPDKNVSEWMARIQPERLFLTSITVGEIRKGLAKLPNSKRKVKISEWINTLLEEYESRIISIDLPVAENWGENQGLSENEGKPIPTIDGLIASVARVHNLVLVTRNEQDFENCNVSILNPWKIK
ncbi:MAG: type II toxin-antitoxin system VapC family toxin [Candidatus Riflebacteria bacterium]|nr:type II toxin-antitoxin system VapC family toxin [Candidatus Riflebacteria bacterium]